MQSQVSQDLGSAWWSDSYKSSSWSQIMSPRQTCGQRKPFNMHILFKHGEQGLHFVFLAQFVLAVFLPFSWAIDYPIDDSTGLGSKFDGIGGLNAGVSMLIIIK